MTPSISITCNTLHYFITTVQCPRLTICSECLNSLNIPIRFLIHVNKYFNREQHIQKTIIQNSIITSMDIDPNVYYLSMLGYSLQRMMCVDLSTQYLSLLLMFSLTKKGKRNYVDWFVLELLCKCLRTSSLDFPLHENLLT